MQEKYSVFILNQAVCRLTSVLCSIKVFKPYEFIYIISYYSDSIDKPLNWTAFWEKGSFHFELTKSRVWSVRASAEIRPS